MMNDCCIEIEVGDERPSFSPFSVVGSAFWRLDGDWLRRRGGGLKLCGCMMEPIFPDAAFLVRVGLEAAKVCLRLMVGEFPYSS